MGCRAWPRGSLFGVLPLRSDIVLYYLVLAAFVVQYLFIRRVVHSPFGQVLKGNSRQRAARHLAGLRHQPIRLLAFVLSATLAGFAGSLKTLC